MKKLTVILCSVVLLFAVIYLVLLTPDISREELKKKYTNEASKFIEIDGLNVHYRQEGNGPHLLLLHGTASSLHTWDGWVEEMKNDFTITRLDLPAFGLTGAHPEGDYSIDFYTNFLHEFITILKIDSFHIAGNSLGGGISWSYALKHPEKIKTLILIDASGYPSEGLPFVFKIARNDLTAGLLKKVTPRSFVEKNIKEVYYDDSKITKSLIDRYYELTLATGNRQAFIDRARTNIAYQYKEISDIKVPTLILWGKHDEWVALEDAYQFHEDIDNSQLIIYESGHIPMEELPIMSAKDALLFLHQK